MVSIELSPRCTLKSEALDQSRVVRISSRGRIEDIAHLRERYQMEHFVVAAEAAFTERLQAIKPYGLTERLAVGVQAIRRRKSEAGYACSAR